MSDIGFGLIVIFLVDVFFVVLDFLIGLLISHLFEFFLIIPSFFTSSLLMQFNVGIRADSSSKSFCSD